ncbi:hypothetical protein BpHYR1_032332 [Brachionus plicatilis]|uniref:Uncharacterized protein n=1 Tax=Brachionus plicatilis TaxID=10195 RepID=A0A3M7S1H4_BRAPC|nr:hypothetical protein BpHYR1_032332 [Brachionus plicatilis]
MVGKDAKIEFINSLIQYNISIEDYLKSYDPLVLVSDIINSDQHIQQNCKRKNCFEDNESTENKSKKMNCDNEFSEIQYAYNQ